jgi:purine-binding chemotaxis protein CheW
MNGSPSRFPEKKPTPIDWQEVRRRLDAFREALEETWTPDPQQAERILEARTRALARPPAGTTVVTEGPELIEFTLAGERYAFESPWVREVTPLENLTPLPCTPPFVLGIVNLRGEILSVVDLRRFFDLPEKALTDRDRILVLESGPMRFGILADAVLGIRSIPLAAMQSSLPTLTGIREKYLKGVTPERTVLLDAEKLLADPGMVVQEQGT